MKWITIGGGEIRFPKWPRLDRWLDDHEVDIVLWSVWFGLAGFGLICWAHCIMGGNQ